MTPDIETIGEDHLSPEALEIPEKGEIPEALRSRLDHTFLREVQEWVAAESEPPPGLAEVRRMLSVIKESMSDLIISERGER